MGDGIVNQTFTANITDLENKMAQAERTITRLTEAQRKTKQESLAGHDAFKHILSEQNSELIGLVSRYASVGFAIESVIKAYEKYEERLKKIEEANEKIDQSLARSLAKSNLLANAPAIEEWAKKNIGRGYTREQSQAAIMGAAAGAPAAGFEKQMGIAEATLPAAPLMATGDLQNLAETVGRVSNFLPGKSSQEITNLVESLETRLGSEKGKAISDRAAIGGMRALVESGAASAEQAMALQSIALQSELPSSFVEQIAGKILAPADAPKKRGHLTESDVSKRKFEEAAPAERLKMILEDPQIQEAELGRRLMGRVKRIPMADVDVEAGELLKAMKTDVLGEKLGQLQMFEGGKRGLAEQGHAVEAEKFNVGELGKTAYYWAEANKLAIEIANRKEKAGERGPIGWLAHEGKWYVDKFLQRLSSPEDFKNGEMPQEAPLFYYGATKAEIGKYREDMQSHFQPTTRAEIGTIKSRIPELPAPQERREEPRPASAAAPPADNATRAQPSSGESDWAAWQKTGRPYNEVNWEEFRKMRQSIETNQATNAAAARRVNGRE
jgi:hypothetical protein